MTSYFVNSNTPVSRTSDRGAEFITSIASLWPLISVLVHTKSAVRPAQEQPPLQETICRSLSSSPASGNYTLPKPFAWLEKIFVSLTESQLVLIHRKASSVIESKTAVGNHLHLGGNNTRNKHFFPSPKTFISSTVPDKTLFRDPRSFS